MTNNRSKIHDMTLMALMCALIIVSAMLSKFFVIPSPLGDAHFTPQWLVVVMCGLILGRKKGAATVCLYLLIGLIGFPVFASGGGIGYLFKPTFGFLLGYVVGAYVVGLMSESIENKTLQSLIIPLTVSFIAYYLIGFIYYFIVANFVFHIEAGLWLIFASFCLPTLLPDYIFSLVAGILSIRILKILK